MKKALMLVLALALSTAAISSVGCGNTDPTKKEPTKK